MLNSFKYALLSIAFVFASHAYASDAKVTKAPEDQTHIKAQQANADAAVAKLEKPLYNAFTERYLLDEVKTLRQMLAETRVDFTEQMAEKELKVADRALMYATDTVTYFFYLLAGASSLLVVVGWTSLRDVKERVGSYAHDEIQRITQSYEERLNALERELSKKSKHIVAAQEEIELTNEIHSLWLKASQEANAQGKIAIYDQILALRPEDIEALTYKADAALALGQNQWATSLANRALEIDPSNGHALYQRACAYAEAGYVEESLRDLEASIECSEVMREQAATDSSFDMLSDDPRFQDMIKPYS